MRRSRARAAALAFLAAFALPGAPAPAAAQVPPDQDWRTIESERARITFPAHLEALARRAAWRTDRALEALDEAFMPVPRGPIDVVLTDHTDLSNGFAQVTPSNRVTIFARPPVDELSLGYFDDWLELVLTHEIAHLVHLDYPGTGLGRLLRGVFGRVPARWPYFPALSTPRWTIEGLATWYETALTSSGRLHGAYFDMQLRTAVLEDRFEGLAEASVPSPVWPSGTRPYLYGSLFFEYLLGRYGEEKMADFVRAVAGQWIPYRLNSAGRHAFGVSLSDAWREWGDSLRADVAHLDARLARQGPITEPELLTVEARWAIAPEQGPDGRVAYVRSDGRSDPELVVAPPEALHDAGGVRVNGVPSFDRLPDGRVVLSQLEYQDPYRVYADLWVLGPDGESRRLTDGARVQHPTATPDGRRAVATQQGGGTSRLVWVDLEDGAVTPLVEADPDRHWAWPAVSPDGRHVAATRWEPGGWHDVVVLDARDGRVVAELTRDRAVDHHPRWSPDGRWIVWASDRTGIPNVLGASFDPHTGRAGAPRLLTNVRTGAAYPSVSADGRWIWFSAYHATGWEVARVPFAPGEAPAAPEPVARYLEESTLERGSLDDVPVQDYAPFRSLLPRYWMPQFRPPVRTPASFGGREILGWAFGAVTSGQDLTARHAYSASLRVFTSGEHVEGGLAYGFFGLGNPRLSLSAWQQYDEGGAFLPQPDPELPPDTLFVLERQRGVFATGSLLRVRERHTAQLLVSTGLVEQHDELFGNDLEPSTEYRLTRPTSRLGELQLSAVLSNARAFSFQVGASKGLDLQLSARARRDWSVPDELRGEQGADRSFREGMGRLRGYLPLGGPGYGTHVLAGRIVGGIADGPEAARGHFEVGGSPGLAEPFTGFGVFGGSPELFYVRGYPELVRVGRYAWAASGEYRFPLAYVHRGLGTGFYLGRLSGALFADAGDAWDPGGEGLVDPARSALLSAGAELSTELILFWDFGALLRTGVAFPFRDGYDPSVYLRLGVPF